MENPTTFNGVSRPQHTEVRVSQMIRAYLDLESTANRDLSTDAAVRIESALAIIQLLGTVTQIQLAQQFIEQFVKNRSGSFDALLEDLRQDIRASLGLEAQPGIRLIRIMVPRDAEPTDAPAKANASSGQRKSKSGNADE
jgi:hypothetical protein